MTLDRAHFYLAILFHTMYRTLHAHIHVGEQGILQ